MSSVSVTTKPHAARSGVLNGIGAGAGGALAMLIAMALLRWLLGFPTYPEMMLDTFLRLLGGRTFSNLLDEYYYAGLPLYFTLVLLGVLLVGSLLGLLYAWLARPDPATGRPHRFLRTPWSSLLFGAAIALLLNLLFLPIVGQAPFAGEFRNMVAQTSLPPWVGLSLLGLTFGIVTHELLPRRITFGGEPRATDAGRRQVLRIGAGALLALLGGAAFWYGGTVLRQGGFSSPVTRKPETEGAAGGEVPGEIDMEIGQPLPDETPTSQPSPTEAPTSTPQPTTTATPEPTSTPTSTSTQTPTATSTPTSTATSTPNTPASHPEVPIPIAEITPNASFYHVSKNVFDPTVSADGWKLSIKGMVENPYELTYDELRALPSEEVTTGMMCISNPVGGGLIGSTTWRGVRLVDLLKRARPKRGVVDLLMSAADGYTDSITYAKAQDTDVVLVWEMGGEPLTNQHGFPARLLVPGIYGMKHMKWLQSIELVGYDYKGFWQQPDQGWSDPAPVQTMSRIDYPDGKGLERNKAYTVSGIAFAGDRSISKVELSIDGGKTWKPAYVKPPLSGTSWAVWGYSWTPTKAGKFTVTVRAYDGAGKVQAGKATDPYPNGASAYHRVTMTVK
jgi:DMSO/TMAO reductase YedYZ molybdopterin-dependent catalytic subunit